MSRLRNWLGKITNGIGVAIFAIFVWDGLWHGWVLPIWHNPKGFFQGVYLLALVIAAVLAFLKTDENYTERLKGRDGLAVIVLHFAVTLAVPIGVLVVGFFLFRGIWPEGVAFHLSVSGGDTYLL